MLRTSHVPCQHAWTQQTHDTRDPRCAGPCPQPCWQVTKLGTQAPHMMAPNCPFPPHFARFQATHPPSGITNSSKKRGTACMRCMRPWWPLKHLLRHAEVRTSHVRRWSTTWCTDTGYVRRHWIPTDTTRIGVSTADMRVYRNSVQILGYFRWNPETTWTCGYWIRSRHSQTLTDTPRHC